MNWRKGIFRAWVVFTVLWEAVMVPWMVIEPSGAAISVVAIIGVPAALLAFGFMAAWVFKGFRKEQPLMPARQNRFGYGVNILPPTADASLQ